MSLDITFNSGTFEEDSQFTHDNEHKNIPYPQTNRCHIKNAARTHSLLTCPSHSSLDGPDRGPDYPNHSTVLHLYP